MLALHRRIIKALKNHAPDISVELVREKKHVVLDFTHDVSTTRITIAKSPTNADSTYRNACTDVCKALKLPRISH